MGNLITKKTLTLPTLGNTNWENQNHLLEFEFFNNFESAHTRKCYKRDIIQFLQFINHQFPIIKNITECQRIHLIAFKTWLNENDFAPKTANRKLSAVSSYFDFLVEKNLLENNPSQNIKRPKQTVKKPTLDISDNDVLEIFKQIEISNNLLHKAIIYLFFATGIRKSELINLKRKEIELDQKDAFINITAKGKKHLRKFLPEIAREKIEDYLRWRESDSRPINLNDWLFQPDVNPLATSSEDYIKPLNEKSIDYIFKKYCKLAGISQNVSPHSARATYIGSALESGVDIFKIAQDVGHSSVQTTEIYNKRRLSAGNSPSHSLPYLKKTS